MSGPSPANNGKGTTNTAPLQALRRFTQVREAVRPPLEHCEFCSEPLPAEHHHVLDLSKRTVMCSCNACKLLFGHNGAGDGKYRAIPNRYLLMPDFQMSDEQWEELMIPVNMLYIFRTLKRGEEAGTEHIMAFYPSPAGAIESLLSLENWESLVRDNAILQELEPDVEALLINRVGDKHMHYIVPIDMCYHLVGLIRLSWKGLGGGEEVWKAIADFFTDLDSKTQAVRGEPHA
jgi:Family of unknown function (DUF5947)